MPAADDHAGDAGADSGAVLPGTARSPRGDREDIMTAARIVSLAAAMLLALAASAAAQDNLPARPIKFVVPLAAGGGIDFTARVTPQALSGVIGQQVLDENQ